MEAGDEGAGRRSSMMQIGGNRDIGNSENTTELVQMGPSSSNALVVSGLNHDDEHTLDWSLEEQSILEQGLIEYDALDALNKYILIASCLPRKTVRDVATRCNWLAQHKTGKQHVGKKLKYGTRTNIDQSSGQVPKLDSATWELIHENDFILQQISYNMSTLNIEENFHLLNRMKGNITAVLNNTSVVPNMPPFLDSVNESLLNSINDYRRSRPPQHISGVPGIPSEQRAEFPRHDNL